MTTLERDAAMIADPERWPCHPLLPLRRRSGAELGYLNANDMQYIVHVGNIYLSQFAQVAGLYYASVGALLKEWKVD